MSEISDCKTAIAWYEECLSRAKDYPAWVRQRSELGARFSTRTFENIDSRIDKTAYDICKRYAETFRETDKGLILIGDVGIGKTHLAAAIANYLIDSLNITVCFGTVTDLLDKVKTEFSLDKNLTMRSMKTMPLLVIDDLGKEKQTEWTNQALYEIVNARYEGNLPIVITTNLTLKEIARRYDRSITSRLNEMCQFVLMSGADYRERGRTENV